MSARGTGMKTRSVEVKVFKSPAESWEAKTLLDIKATEGLEAAWEELCLMAKEHSTAFTNWLMENVLLK